MSTEPEITCTPIRSEPAAELWDPGTQIGDALCREIGLDPATASRTIGGVAPPRGFALWSAHDIRRMYSVTVWSQVYTVEDFRRKEAGSHFHPRIVAGRTAFRYTPAGDTTGDHCIVIFPAQQGSWSIQVIRQSARAPGTPCAKALKIAAVLARRLPVVPSQQTAPDGRECAENGERLG